MDWILLLLLTSPASKCSVLSTFYSLCFLNNFIVIADFWGFFGLFASFWKCAAENWTPVDFSVLYIRMKAFCFLYSILPPIHLFFAAAAHCSLVYSFQFLYIPDPFLQCSHLVTCFPCYMCALEFPGVVHKCCYWILLYWSQPISLICQDYFEFETYSPKGLEPFPVQL